jgi:hypothetical protein
VGRGHQVAPIIAHTKYCVAAEVDPVDVRGDYRRRKR